MTDEKDDAPDEKGGFPFDDYFPMGSLPLIPNASPPAGIVGELFVTDAAGNFVKLGDVTHAAVQYNGGDLMKTVAAMMKAVGITSIRSAPDPSVADAFIFAFIGESMRRPIVCPNPFSLVAELCNQFGHTRPLIEEYSVR